MPDRPTRTLTFLFTDIESSTSLWERFPDEMARSLERHDELLRGAVERHGGYVFTTAGDSFAVAFEEPSAALAAAIEAQRELAAEPWPENTPVRVRMGLHQGRAQERDGDYFGSDVNRAARVMSVGHGGQIVVSASVALVSDTATIDLGEHRLRDLSKSEHLHQVVAEGIGRRFPPLRTIDSFPGNLPADTSSFLGRDTEVSAVVAQVREHRLVTLTGIGGVGKTRLALRAAADLVAEVHDGAWLVELASIADGAAVAAVVARILGVTIKPSQDITESIVQALAGRDLLLVLDNCEHLLDPVASLVETILARTDNVRILATSREGLRLGVEQLWPVPPLGTGDGAGSAAVQLFIERAVAVRPSFELVDPEELQAVVEICRSLDGLALAIELAAARMVSMTPADVRDRLDDRFRLLSTRNRVAARHQTLQQAVSWSFDLLDEDEQSVFCACSVFVDGFGLAAAEDVCVALGLDDYQLLDLLDSLVRKSLLVVAETRSPVRYRMLETIRRFAATALAERGQMDGMRDAHAGYFAGQAEIQLEVAEGSNQGQALAWVEDEFANLRAAFRWAQQRNLEVAVCLAAHTTLLAWPLQTYESVAWTEEVLAAAEAADLPQLPRLYTAASFCMFVGQPEEAVGRARRAVALEGLDRYVGCQPGFSRSREAQALRACGQIEQSLAISQELAAGTGPARVNGMVGALFVLSALGRSEEARGIAELTLAEARAFGNPTWIAVALAGYGRAFADVDPIRALEALREGMAFSHDHRLRFARALIARELAGLEALHGDLETSLSLFEDVLVSFHRAGDRASLGVTLPDLARFFLRVGDPTAAATLVGFAQGRSSPDPAAASGALADEVRSTCGEELFTRHAAIGASMDLAAAVRFARDQIRREGEKLLQDEVGTSGPSAGA